MLRSVRNTIAGTRERGGYQKSQLVQMTMSQISGAQMSQSIY
jgi:hypothetical protein